MKKRSYKELKELKTFQERYDYLKLDGQIGEPTFGGSRYLNQVLYHSNEWAEVCNKVIIRDNGCDLGIPGRPIQWEDKDGNTHGKILVHHINPVTKKQIMDRDPALFDMDNLISSSFKTHNGIHFGKKSVDGDILVERKPGDTCPWKINKEDIANGKEKTV